MSVLSRMLRRDDGDVPGAVVVEPMRRRHLGDVTVIERGSYPKPWPETVFTTELEMARRGERTYLVARIDGHVAGYAGLMYVLEDAHVTNIAVAATRQRSGVGTRLLAELFWAAIGRGCTSMTLEVRATNVAAQQLYRRFGFVPAGVRQRYYENVDDAIVMWCHDIGAAASRRRLVELSPEAGQ